MCSVTSTTRRISRTWRAPRTDPHPISGKTVGAVDLTCWRSDAGPLLMTLAKTTAVRSDRRYLPTPGAGDRAAPGISARLSSYPGIVIALNNEVVMMNDYARTVLAPAEGAALLQQAARSARRTPQVSLGRSPDRDEASDVHPVSGFTAAGRGVIHAESGPTRHTEAGESTRCSGEKMLLPGSHQDPALCGVGHATKWKTPTARVSKYLLAGEPGVGKVAILRAVHQHRNPEQRVEAS